MPLPVCSGAITKKKNGCESLKKKRVSCIFENKKDAENFFEFLTYQHKNIKFTIEKEKNKILSFLDILIKKKGNRFSTSVYQRKTSIGLFT